MKKNTKCTLAIISLIVVVFLTVVLWLLKVIDINKAGVVLVTIGVIFYFIFTSIYYDDSIMGGKFQEHFKNIHDKN